MLTLDLGSLEPWEHWTLVTQNLGHKGSWEHRLAGFNTDHFHQITDRLVAIITFCSWSVIEQSVLIVPSYAERLSSDGPLQNRPVLADTAEITLQRPEDKVKKTAWKWTMVLFTWQRDMNRSRQMMFVRCGNLSANGFRRIRGSVSEGSDVGVCERRPRETGSVAVFILDSKPATKLAGLFEARSADLDRRR